MRVALYSLNASLLDRWRGALAAHQNDVINWSQIDQLEQGELLLVHWQSLTPDQQNRLMQQAGTHPLVVLTDAPKLDEGKALILSGVRGYANSYIQRDLLTVLVTEVEKGNIWAVPELLQSILRGFLENRTVAEVAPYDLSQLSHREMEVYQALMKGLSNKEIARSLDITERTVKAHVASILGKTGAPDRVHLIVHGTA